MKKSLIAIGVIVALGVVWTGTAWYTGKQFEQRLPVLVDNANTQIKSTFPDAGIKLVVKDYHRHFFSSQIKVVLQSDGSTGENKPLKPGDELVIEEAVDHGPFPLSQLKKGIFIPSMASVHSQLSSTPLVKPIMDASQGKSPITALTRVSYNGDTVSAIDLAALDYKNDNTLFRTSGGRVNASIDRGMKQVAIEGGVDSLVIGGLNQWQMHELVTLQNFTIDSHSHKSPQGYSIGDNALKLKTLVYAIDGKDLFSVDNLSQVTNAAEDGDKLNVQVTYGLNMLHAQGQDFGSGKLLIRLANLDANAIKQFSDQYQSQVQQIMHQTGETDPSVQQDQITQALIQHLPIALKGSPYLTIAPLSWKNAKGESAFNLTLNLNDPSQAPQTPTAVTPDQQFAHFVKKLDAKLTIPLDMATQLTAQIAKLQGYNEDDSQKLAKQQIQGLAAMGQMFKLTTVDDNVLTSSFHYADNQVDLNGQKMTLQNFLGLFGLFGGPNGTAQPQQPAQQ